MKIKVNNKEYSVKVFTTDEEKETGLQGVTELAENEGALFVYDDETELAFWMQDTQIPLDIIFINSDWEVIAVCNGEPMSEEVHQAIAQYVLEVNQGSGITLRDEVDLSELEDDDVEYDEEDEDAPMLILGPKGKVQGELKGGERIFSRVHTKTLIRLAKKAYKSKKDEDYKRLGRKMFQYIEKQDTQDPEYVTLKK